MSEKKFYVDVNLQDNEVVKLKADTLDITTNLASANTKRIVYYNGDYYYSDGTNWILASNVVPTGGTTGQVLAKIDSTDYNTQWVNQSSGLPHGTASGTDTYTVTISGVTSYSDGDAYLIRFTNGNTTSCTLNINSIGAIPLYRNNDGQLIGGDIVANAEMLCVYNSTLNVFQAIGTAPNTLLAYVTNDDSVTLTKGMPVYAFSGTGDRMTVKRAKNTTDATSAQTVGLVLSASIAANQKGLIMMQGLLDGLSILPTSTFADGDAVYLGATDGSITNIKPSAPNHLVYLGVVTTASNGSSGRMYVRVQNGYELQELHNVSIDGGTLANDQVLTYESATQLWKNKTIPTALGYTPENVANKENTTLDNSTTKYPTNNLVKTNIDTKVTANTTITGATKTKITYDSKGLVTSGADATTADIADSLNKRYVTDANLTVIGNTSGTNTGDETNTTIKTKLGAASTTTDGYLTSTDWNTFNGKQNALGFTPENVANKSTDTNLGTSNTLYPTQNAVKTYADNLLGNANALVYKGVIDCSGNPNYPAANAGELYIASVAGKIGGASGIDVEVGDMIICNTDSTPSGDQATVGAYWNIIQKNIIGAVTGPASSTNGNVAFFDGVTGKVIKDSGITLSGTNTGDQTLSGLGGVPTTRTVSTTSPLSGGGDLSADRTLSIADAVADGATKGAAAFTANDFNSASGVISIDYANGQKASSTQDGFLSSANWSTFNGKQDALGFTPEDVANKKTTMTGNTTSNVFYLTAKAIYDWATGLFVQTTRNLTVNGTSADLSADRTFTVTDANLSTSDITTNDVSTTKHGFAPKLPNDATKYLDGTGNYSTPAGGGGGDILQFQVFS